MAGQVTAIEPQKRSSMRVNIYLDGEFAFGLALSVAEQVRIGQHLSDEMIATLRAQDEAERAREKSLDYLSYRPRSEAEMRRYLSGKDFSEDVIDRVLDRLLDVGLVDDADFARYWVDNRTRFKPRGQRALRYELRQKGVDSTAIEAALEDFDERAAAYRVAESQGRRISHLPPDAFQKRLTQRMARRGFPYPLIREILDAYPFPDFNSDENKEI